MALRFARDCTLAELNDVGSSCVSMAVLVGTNVGGILGMLVGWVVGEDVGARVGQDEGASVGKIVGADVDGCSDGASVGTSVGDFVGVEVGWSVGAVASPLTHTGESSTVQSGFNISYASLVRKKAVKSQVLLLAVTSSKLSSTVTGDW